MTDDDRIEAWARLRATADASPDFVDRVVAATQEDRGMRALEMVAVVAAAALGALRIAAALAVFFTPPGALS